MHGARNCQISRPEPWSLPPSVSRTSPKSRIAPLSSRTCARAAARSSPDPPSPPSNLTEFTMTGQTWSVATEGGFMYSDELSDTLRIQVQPLTKFRQLCDAQDG